MPPLPESLMTSTATSKFRSFNLTLPSFVSLPGGRPPNVAQYLVQSQAPGFVVTAVPAAPVLSPAVTSGLRVATVPTLSVAPTVASANVSSLAAVRPTGTPLSMPPALFKSASNDMVDVAFQQEASDAFTAYISGICHAIVAAHSMWRTTAFLTGAVINGPNVTGGSIAGPALTAATIAASGPPPSGLWGAAGACTQAVADGVASAWLMWSQSVRVPGLAWYPAFAAFPGPMAPPTPNIPSPLTALTSVQTPLTEGPLAATLSRTLTQPTPFGPQLVQAIAAGLSTACALWVSAQIVTNALGQGPVPTFAPPYVPVGQVIGGSIVPAPGLFAA